MTSPSGGAPTTRVFACLPPPTRAGQPIRLPIGPGAADPQRRRQRKLLSLPAESPARGSPLGHARADSAVRAHGRGLRTGQVVGDAVGDPIRLSVPAGAAALEVCAIV